jgi:hypothetical protein
MPTHLKKLVRSRMAKTGESYATALRYVRLRGAKRRADEKLPVPVRTLRIRYTGARRNDPAIDSYTRSVEGPMGEMLARLVALVRSAVPSHDEVLFRGAPSFCVGGEPFCYVVGYPKHVHLGFCDGVALSDPAKLLRGKGKSMRHVRLSAKEPLPAAALAHLVAQSARRVRALRAADPAGAKEVRDARR